MTELEIEALIERAAERGAKKALADVGLHDEEAGQGCPGAPQPA
jgi:Family of unknown function (DUF6127)